MKKFSDSRKLSVMMLFFGFAAFLLRTALYAAAVDVKGLLMRGHPLEIVLMVLTAAVLLLVAWVVRKQETVLPADAGNLSAAVGNVAAGAGILATVLTGQPVMNNYLGIAWRYLGFAAPVCLVLAGAARVVGKRPFFLLHVVSCLFFLLHIITRYQLWSAQPQMQNYVFALLGAAALMFFGFYTAAGEADCGNPQMRLGMGLAAGYLCMAELARSSGPALYLGGILWVLTELRSGKKQTEN